MIPTRLIRTGFSRTAQRGILPYHPVVKERGSRHIYTAERANEKRLVSQSAYFAAEINMTTNNHTTTTPSPSPSPMASSPTTTSVSSGTKRKRPSSTKFYAVKEGFRPGVYYNWNDCLAQVTGFKGAVCECLGLYTFSWKVIICLCGFFSCAAQFSHSHL